MDGTDSELCSLPALALSMFNLLGSPTRVSVLCRDIVFGDSRWVELAQD